MKLKEFSPKAIHSILNSIARINIWTGAVRSSKTISSIIRLVELAASNRIPKDIKGVLVGKTIGTLEKNVLEDLASIVGSKNYQYRSTKKQVILYGRKFDVVGAKDEGSKDLIQGMTYGIGYCDEITLYPQSFWNMLQTRFISILNYCILATCNPESPYHWLKVNFIDKAIELGINVFKFDLDDNLHMPLENKLSLIKSYTGVFYQRYILGLWVLAEGLIYSMFDEKKHLFDNLTVNNEYQKYNLAIDYGTQNPFCAGLFTRVENKHYMMKEYYYCGRDSENGKLKTNEEYCDDIADFVGSRIINKIDIDPSAIAFITSLKKQYPKLGQKINDHTDNSVKEGIENVSSCLGLGELLIHKNCKNTRKEFAVYSWDEKKAMSTGKEQPLKVNDHAMDMIRYYIRNNWFTNSPKTTTARVLTRNNIKQLA